MIRLALASLLACAVLPASAPAAGFGALPVLPVQPAARCLRATGAPGELVRWEADGAELIEATAAGFATTTRVALGDMLGCPSAAARPGGAGVLAAALDLQGIGTALRDPGGSWLPATTIALEPGHEVEDLATAVSGRGDGLVAWTESEGLNHDVARVLVARRTPGGALGEPVVPGSPHAFDRKAPTVRAALQADGAATVLWTQGRPGDSDVMLAFVAVAPPGQPFGPPQRLSDVVEGAPSLAVAPDGRALAVIPETRHTLVLERPPGGAAFTPVASVDLVDLDDDEVGFALRADGAAIVAWADDRSQRVFAIRRDGPGAFGPPEPLAPAPEDPYAAALPLDAGDAPDDTAGRGIRAAFAGDGRPVVTWGAPQRLGALNWVAAAAATFPGALQQLSGPLRNADSIAPVILADGTPAVAWSDVAPGGAPLLHLAPAGAPEAPPPSPAVTLGAVTQVPHGLRVPFRCSAACDVRASVPGGAEGLGALKSAGTATLKLDAEYQPIPVPPSGRVRLRILSGAPGARTPRERTVTVRLRKPALPRVLGLSARQRGRSVAIRWRTARAVHGADFIVEVMGAGEELDDGRLDGDDLRAFHLQLDDVPGADRVRLSIVTHRDSAERLLAIARVR